jgi:hypothetical protein
MFRATHEKVRSCSKARYLRVHRDKSGVSSMTWQGGYEEGLVEVV